MHLNLYSYPQINLFSDAPGIHLPPSKQVSIELVRGNSTTLKCVAAANPSPTFTWRKGKHEISDGFYSTWNSSSLKVTPVSTGDFTSYVCTAKNRLGWDSATFDLQEKGKWIFTKSFTGWWRKKCWFAHDRYDYCNHYDRCKIFSDLYDHKETTLQRL